MLLISGIIKLQSEQEVDRVKAALARRAARSRDDGGCIDYVFAVNVEDPREIRLTEKWESRKHLDAHLAVPDEEFDRLMATADIESATVVASEVASEQALLDR